MCSIVFTSLFFYHLAIALHRFLSLRGHFFYSFCLPDGSGNIEAVLDQISKEKRQYFKVRVRSQQIELWAVAQHCFLYDFYSAVFVPTYRCLIVLYSEGGIDRGQEKWETRKYVFSFLQLSQMTECTGARARH